MPPEPLGKPGDKTAILIHSQPGAGKTTLAGSSAELGRTLILRPPTEHLDHIRPEHRPNVDEWVIEDHGALDDAYNELRGSKKYSWVWWDSISGWQDTGLDDLWQTVISEKPARARYGPDKPEYGINMNRISSWVRHMVGQMNEGCFNFGITAWVRELAPYEDDAGDDLLMPWVQGKNMSPKICGYMKAVAYLDVTSKGTRLLRTDPNRKVYVKGLDNIFEKGRLIDPTMKKVMDGINKARGDRAKPRTAQAKRRRVVKGR